MSHGKAVFLLLIVSLIAGFVAKATDRPFDDDTAWARGLPPVSSPTE